MSSAEEPEDSPPHDSTYYRSAPKEQVIAALRSNPTRGLSAADAEERLRRYGRNEVVRRRENPVLKLGRKFWGLTAWMLELTVVFSLILRDYLDVCIIAALLVVNAAVGFAQEERASSAVEALRVRLEVASRVMRDGRWQTVHARELVPGDIVRVRAGDFVPADLKVIQGTDLGVDQSVLTGESMTVEKREGDLLYSGSTINRGETNAVVVLTGGGTFYGKTAELLQAARPKLHMEEVTSRVVRWLLLMVGVLIALVLAVSYLDRVDIVGVIPLALVLIVFAVPVALPAMFTVSMAIGSLELSKKGVLVTRLSASEDAASMDVLCADKTGTITTNRLSVASVFAAEGFGDDDVILCGALASQEANQDPVDIAFISAARERRLMDASYVQRTFVPFDPTTRRTEARVISKGRELTVTKGAVDALLQLCGPVSGKGEIEDRVKDFASKGYRTLAVAVSGPAGSLAMCGIVALYDAPRRDSGELIQELKELGISVKMLTGDALPIAKEVSNQVGLGGSIVRASDLKSEVERDPARAAQVAEGVAGFAEVYPQDKYLIVKSLQAGGHVTGMTGDGVNDAPALRQAEVGIAVSNATDVAKGAASAVLTQEGLTNIVGLVEVGRMIYQRMITWIINKVVKTFEVAVFVALAFLLTGYYVVSALDIVLLLFAVDFVTISLSTDRVRWSKRPEKWNVASLVKVGVLLGVMTTVELFGLLFVGLNYLGLTGSVATLHTFTFASLFYLGMFTVLIARERSHFWRSAPSRTLLLSIALDMVAVAALVTVGMPGLGPLPPAYLALILAYVILFSLTLNDQVKRVLMSRFGTTV